METRIPHLLNPPPLRPSPRLYPMYLTRGNRYYNLLYNVIILCSLFSMLQYTGLDDRMALLTRSVYESLSDLVPFMLLFAMFILIFGWIGHLLCAPPAYSTGIQHRLSTGIHHRHELNRGPLYPLYSNRRSPLRCDLPCCLGLTRRVLPLVCAFPCVCQTVPCSTSGGRSLPR